MSDEEMTRWQDEIRRTVIERSGAPDSRIDGGGCDSGDPLDVTLAEVRQGINYAEGRREELVADLLAACKAALETFDRLEDAYPTKFGGVGGMFDRHAPQGFSLGTLRAAIAKAQPQPQPSR